MIAFLLSGNVSLLTTVYQRMQFVEIKMEFLLVTAMEQFPHMILLLELYQNGLLQ